MPNVATCNPKNNAELKQIRSTLNLERKTIAQIAQVSKTLVDNWLVAETSAHFRAMPLKSLRLIKLELGLEAPAYRRFRKQAEQRAAAIKGA